MKLNRDEVITLFSGVAGHVFGAFVVVTLTLLTIHVGTGVVGAENPAQSGATPPAAEATTPDEAAANGDPSSTRPAEPANEPAAEPVAAPAAVPTEPAETQTEIYYEVEEAEDYVED